jgi:hypothetical protein
VAVQEDNTGWGTNGIALQTVAPGAGNLVLAGEVKAGLMEGQLTTGEITNNP